MTNTRGKSIAAMLWLALIILVANGYGEDVGVPAGKNVNVAYPPEFTKTLLDASPAASTGMSAVTDMGMKPKSMTCVFNQGGTAPTSWTFTIYTGPDSTNMFSIPIDSSTNKTITTFPYGIDFNTYPMRYWKINNTSTVGGDGTTTYTVKCTGTK